MVVTWWIVAFLSSAETSYNEHVPADIIKYTQEAFLND